MPRIHVKQSLLGVCGTSLKGQKKVSGERIGDALKSSGQRVEQELELDGEAVRVK
jgi:hypothetical protein